MTVYLDEQLDDEPMFGIVARYIEMSPSIAVGRVIELIFGQKTQASLLGRNYSHVAVETQSCWGLTPKEIIHRMTLFPYVSNLIDEEASDDLIGAMLVSRSRGKKRNDSWPALGCEGFRYCRRCIAEDLEQGVPKHWRRTHQLPGVTVCVHHAEFLWMYSVGGGCKLNFVTPEVAQTIGVSPIVRESMDVRKEVALQYAKMSHDLLNGRVKIDRRYIYGAVREKIKRKLRYIDDDELRKIFPILIGNCFGGDYMACVGYRATRFAMNSYSFEKSRALSVVTFAIMLELIEQDPTLLDDCHFKAVYGNASSKIFRRSPHFRARPPVECPNTLAEHGAGHIVERTAWRDSALQCACTCGMRFRCAELDVGIGPPQINRWGEAYVREVMRLRSAGYGSTDISKMLGLPLRTVFNMYSA